MKILIVDDMEVNLELLEARLEGSGYEVTSAKNGVEALEKLKKDSFDMIISDILMPKMDGFQLCMECKKDDTLRKIPFIFYTATYTDKKDEEFALSLGAEKFIVKPAESKSFMEIIRDIFKNYKKGLLAPSKISVKEEEIYLKEYNERLINKLEKKMLDLESEITERKQAEENIKHLNAVLRSIRGVNQLIIREKDREILLQKACDVLIEARGYEASCLGFLSDEKTFAIVAGSGFGEYISRFSEHVMDGDHPPCIKNALAQKGHLMIVDKSKVCGDCFFKNTCVGRKAAIIRVEHANRLFGLLVILFAPDVTPDEEEKGLLKEVAGDIALSLHNMELEEEHKRAEEALRESEKKYRRIFENIQDVYYESSLDGTILETSPSIEKVSKYNRKELIGRSLYDIYTNPEERDEFVKIILDKGKVNDFEISLTDKDGSQHLCSITTLLVKDELGNPIKFIGSMHDISERKQAEEEKKKLQAQLQQAQKMEAIGTLAGGIAHDFNNILTLIMGYTELTMMNLPEDSPFRDNMNKLFEAGERARDLVKQILTFSRQREEEQKPVQIHLIVKEALKLLRPTLPTTIEIQQNITSTGTVMADPTQMHQVLMNLCTNAYHAMQEKGGVLEVSLQNVDFGFRISEFEDEEKQSAIRNPQSPIGLDPGPYIRLTVSDTGHGIKKKDIDRIFEPYYTTKEKTGGTGMGLAVVHGIVKSHGGVITVYSKPGKGSTFNVFLPRIKSTEGVVEPEEIIPLPIGKERILLVDDEPFICEIGKGMLEHLGYQVTTRTSSIEALEAFRAQPEKFDLVITDMTMPRMTGDKLAKELMRIRPNLPIILCTGFSELIDEDKAKAIGIRAFVMKPIVQREMAEAIREALDK